MEISGGFNISQLFDQTLQGVQNKGADLTAKMAELSAGENLGTEEMLAMQFQVGQYNAMMEALSTVTKSMTDMMKSLAQRSN